MRRGVADEIHPDDAALIAEAVSAGRVVVCPAGAACAGIYDTPTVRERITAEVRAAKARNARLANEAKRPGIMRRRRAVAEMVALGRTTDEIARVLNVSAATVLKDISEMRRGG